VSSSELTVDYLIVILSKSAHVFKFLSSAQKFKEQL